LFCSDLKAANVMLSVKGEIKLSTRSLLPISRSIVLADVRVTVDFGLAVDLSAGPKVEMCGSPFWMPPEMIFKKPHSFPVDIWSMAVSIIELANKRPPNSDSAVRAMFTSAVIRPPSLDKPEKWSEDFHNFLGRCLVVDPAKRATASELLQHPFLNKAASTAEMMRILKEVFVSTHLSETAAFL
jgi:serine/threonine protein kinase